MNSETIAYCDIPTEEIHAIERGGILNAKDRAGRIELRFSTRALARYIGVDYRVLQKIISGTYDGLRLNPSRMALTQKQRLMISELYAPLRLDLLSGDPDCIAKSFNECKRRMVSSKGGKARRDGNPVFAMKTV